MERKHYPIGIETFSEVREKNYVYIDKTEYIHKLVSEGKYFFLSRPRRFGKSLLLSTIKAFFEGRKDLFEGLAISRYDHSWEKYPVFHLNLVNTDTSTKDGILSILEHHMVGWEKLYGESEPGLKLPQRFYGVIQRAFEKTGRQVVVLIDEYDKPFVNSLDNEDLHNFFRGILKPIYSVMKAADQYIKFGMISGVTRFSRLSIFSDINNLRDISMNERFDAICGITEEELLSYCKESIVYLSQALGMSPEDAFKTLKENYDGYHFSENCPDIYNPYSVMSALEDCKIKSFWFATGTPSFLITSLRNSDTYLPDLLNSEADTTELANIDSYADSPVALLFQTGYLTIKGYDSCFKTYHLGLPNGEVSEGFFKDLLPIYMNYGQNKGLQAVRAFCREVIAGNADGFISRLQSFLADIPYDLSRSKPEIYFENNIYIIFKLMDFSVDTEYRTSAGRIDLLIKTDRYIYIIELKLNGSAEDALKQIEDKGYALPFANDSRTIFKIGISFSQTTRNIDHWIISK